MTCNQGKIQSHGKRIVEEGEILILKAQQKGSRSGLACYSLTTNTEKVLSKDCNRYFTSSTSEISIALFGHRHMRGINIGGADRVQNL